jgi:hypothetical protein
MAFATATFTWKFNKIDLAAPGIEHELRQEVASVAFEIEARAKSESAVDLGAQRASIYTVLSGVHDTYDEAVTAAREKNPNVEIVDKVEPSSVMISAVIGVGVDYAIYNELKGKAFLGPAADAVLPNFPNRIEQAVQRGLSKIT